MGSSRHLFFYTSNPSPPLRTHTPPHHPAPPTQLPSAASPNAAPSHHRHREAAASLPTPSAFKSTWKPLRLGEGSSFGRCRQTAKQLLSICAFARAPVSNWVSRTRAMLGAPLATDNFNKSRGFYVFLLWSIRDLAGFSPLVLLVGVCRMSVCLLASHLLQEPVGAISSKIW